VRLVNLWNESLNYSIWKQLLSHVVDWRMVFFANSFNKVNESVKCEITFNIQIFDCEWLELFLKTIKSRVNIFIFRIQFFNPNIDQFSNFRIENFSVLIKLFSVIDNLGVDLDLHFGNFSINQIWNFRVYERLVEQKLDVG